MSKLTDKVAYIRGLAEGMKLNDETNEGKLFGNIIEAMSEMAAEIEALDEAHEELSEYVDSIDEDLSQLEEDFGDYEEDLDDDDFECDCDECDCDDCDGSDECDCDECDCDDCECDLEDCGEVYVECMCPKCHAAFYVKESEMSDSALHVCPRCNERVHANPEYEDEIPIAPLADSDDE